MKIVGFTVVRFLALLSSIWTAVLCHPTTVVVRPKEKLCFFQQSVVEKTEYSVEVFIFYGGNDIGLTVRGPAVVDTAGKSKRGTLKTVLEKNILSTTYKNTFRAPAGEYEVCLSNDRRFEQNTKHVMLDVVQLKDAYSTQGGDVRNELTDNDGDADDMVIIKRDVKQLDAMLAEIKQLQVAERKSLALRTTAAEGNHKSMVRSSLLETVVLLVVSVAQICFVRRWFQGKGTLLKQWA